MKQTNISKELIESFGYEYNQQLNEFSFTNAVTKLGPIANYVYLVWEAYTEITKLPPSLSKEQWNEAATRIIARLITDIGVFWVGTIFGAIIAGAVTGGPGAIIGALAGGFASQYYMGDKAEEVTSKILDAIYPGNDETNNTEYDSSEEQPDNTEYDSSEEQPTEWPTTDAEIRAFQEKNGLTVDGLIGKYTYNALTTQAGLTPPPGFNFVPDKAIANTGQSVSESIAQLRDILATIENR